MDRNAAYKLRSTKFTDASKARAQRFAEQTNNRKNARENLRNAKRGLSETDQNICIEKPLSMQAEKETTRELTHQEKLQERLVRLKEWREQKKMSEQKAKAKKKAPFLVPGVCKSNSRTPVEDQNVSCIETKSCPKSIVQSKKILSDKSWNVTLHESSVKKKSLNKPFKPESISFAPKSFNFCAQLEVGNGSGTSVTLQEEATKVIINPQKKNVVMPAQGSPVPTKILSTQSLTPQMASLIVKENTPKKVKGKPKTPAKQKPINDGSPFRSTMAAESDRLNHLCDIWETVLSTEDVPDEEQGSIRTVIGQAQLLQRERFNQFSGLIHQYETNTGEKEITSTDLQGFWELVYIQVEDVYNKFEKLESLKNNGWVRHDSPMKKAKLAMKKKNAAAARPAAGKSNFRAFLANARKNQATTKSPKTPSRRSSMHFSSPFRTPGSGKSLRKQAMINSAKKPVFLVTDMTDKENTPFEVVSPVSSGISRTPERGSFRKREETTPLNNSPCSNLSAPALYLESPCTSPGLKLRKSMTGKKATPKRASGRASLLPVFQVSPVTPKDDLMSFD